MIDSRQGSVDFEWTRRITTLMRTSEDSHWEALRKRLRESGVDPQDAAVAEFAPDGGYLYAAVLATRDDRVFDLTLQLPAREGEEGFVFAFEELDLLNSAERKEGMEQARHLLADEQPPSP